MKKSDKPLFVDGLTEKLKTASGYILVDFNGLTVKMQQDLKNRLREVGGEMEIVKNTLFKLSAEKAKSPSDITSDTVLQGPTALIVTKEDPIATLQIVAKFAKESEVPQLKVGVVEGSFQDKFALITCITSRKTNPAGAGCRSNFRSSLWNCRNASGQYSKITIYFK